MTGLVCGVDEAGRGPLAGPVCAAAVILGAGGTFTGLADSKQLTPRQRETLAPRIRETAVAWAVAWASVEEIDALNILHATLLAMQRAVAGLGVTPAEALIDGNRCPKLECRARAVVGGDATVPEIMAASILAKTARDGLMRELHARYPEYGFDRHKGYPTAAHVEVLGRLGPSPVHRYSFAPVRAAARALSGAA
jgi:ribonuclease HII